MIPAPSTHVDAAPPRTAGARTTNSARSDFANVLAGFGGDRAQGEAFHPSPDALDETEPQKGAPTPRQPGDTPQASARTEVADPAQDLLKAREVTPRQVDQPVAEANKPLDREPADARTRAEARVAPPAMPDRLAADGEAPEAAGRTGPPPSTVAVPDRAGETPRVTTRGGEAPAIPSAPVANPQPTRGETPDRAPRWTRAAGPAPAAAPPQDSAAPPRETADLPRQPTLWRATDRAELRTPRAAASPLSSEPDLPQARPLGAITVTRQETHLPPLRRPAAIEEQQWLRQLSADTKVTNRSDLAPRPAFAIVAEQLTQALETTRTDADAKLQQATQQAAAAARPLAPVKIVELSLQPASLGALAITMRLTGTGMRVTVSATSRETADLLREDREALATLINGAGYDASEVIVTHRPSVTAQSSVTP